MKYDIQRFDTVDNSVHNLTIVWDDDNNKKKVRPKMIKIGEQSYTPQQETDSTWIFNFPEGVDFSTISLENFEKNYDYVINPISLAVGQDLTNKRIYMSPDYYGYYDDYLDKWGFDFYKGMGYSDNVVDGFFDYLDGGTTGPGFDPAKTFLVGSKDSLEAISDHIDGNYINYVSSSSGLLENVEASPNGSLFTSSFFKGDLIGTINEIDETCPFLNIFQLEQGWNSDTIIKCKVRDYKNPYGFALNLTPEERFRVCGISGASIGNQRILEAKKGNTLIRTFYDWRKPKLGDNLNGQTIKIVYPSGYPIYNTGYETSFLNNEYIVTDGDYMIREAGTYDQVDGASDYSWVIEDYIYSIEIIGRGSEGYFTESIDTIYKTTTRIKTTFGSGGNPTQEIQSQTEDIRKKETTLPSDIGTFVSTTSNMGITFQVDDLRISTKSYSLQSLQGTDNLQNKMILISDFPTNIDKVWFPSLPPMNEYGQFNIPSQYTLFSGEKDFGSDYYVYMISVSIWPTYDMQGQPSAPYSFIISGQNMGGSSTICAKTYGSSDVDTWNKPIIPNQAPQSYTLAEAGLKTSSPLYSYIKKLVWDE